MLKEALYDNLMNRQILSWAGPPEKKLKRKEKWQDARGRVIQVTTSLCIKWPNRSRIRVVKEMSHAATFCEGRANNSCKQITHTGRVKCVIDFNNMHLIMATHYSS